MLLRMTSIKIVDGTPDAGNHTQEDVSDLIRILLKSALRWKLKTLEAENL